MHHSLFFRLAQSLGAILALVSCLVQPGPLLSNNVQAATAHPRLLFGMPSVDAVRTSATTSHAAIWGPIQASADTQLGTTPLAEAPREGDINTYRGWGNMLIPLAFTCMATEREDYCALAKSYLLTYAAWDQWSLDNKTDLGLAHMVQGNALAYDWLYHRLTPDERTAVRQALARHTQRLYGASAFPAPEGVYTNWWRQSYIQNHYIIMHSALGVAALALRGEDERAPVWLNHAAERLSRTRHLLDSIGDGSWHEGIPYQNYGLSMMLPFLTNLRALDGTDLIPHRYMEHYIYWRLYNHLPNGQFLLSYGNFEWGWTTAQSTRHLLRFAASAYHNGHAEWLARQVNAAELQRRQSAPHVGITPWYVFEFFAYNPAIAAAPPTHLSGARVFPDLGGVVWRTGWGWDDLAFGLKSGPYGGRFAFASFVQGHYPWQAPCAANDCQFNAAHNHMDANSFYLARGGHWLAPESVGVGKHDTAYHNTVLIDGHNQYHLPSGDTTVIEELTGSDGQLLATAHTPDFDYAAADATRPYKTIGDVQANTRHVVFVRPGYLLMLDHLAAASSHTYEWVSHFGAGVSSEGNWIRGDAGGGQVLGVGVVAPQPFVASTGNDGQPFVRLRPAQPTSHTRFITLLYPTNEAGWATRPTMALLADTGAAAAVRVAAHDGSRVDDVLLSYATGGAQTWLSSYHYDGQVAVVARRADDSLERLFVAGGSFVTDHARGAPLVSGLIGQPFQASYHGNVVDVFGTIHSEITLYAPDAQHLRINGVERPFTRNGSMITFSDGAS